MKCKITGKSYKTMRTIDAKVISSVDSTAKYDFGEYGILKKDVTLYMRNMDLGYKYIIGSMKLYQLPHYDEGYQWEWSDCKSRCMIDLVQVKKRLCDYDSDEFVDDTSVSNHFILDEFYIRPQYRNKGYAYDCLAEGLVEAGCQNSFIYIYPWRMSVKESSRFEKFETKIKAPKLTVKQLRKFYKNMSPTVTTHTCGSYDNKSIYLAVHNWDYSSARRSKQGVI